MFTYYTALLVVTFFIIFSALIVIYYDEVLEKLNKNIFFTSYFILLVICIFEWLVIYLQKTNSEFHFLTTFLKSILIFIGPSMLVFLGWGIDDTKSKLFSAIVISIITINFIIAFSGLFTDAIFFFDEKNIFHRGQYFSYHFYMVILSILTLLTNTFRVGLKYQNRNNYILVFAFFLFIGGLLTQVRFDTIKILWPSVAIAITILYIYYSSLVNQIDILTGVLNRKCYEIQLYDLNSDAIILFFDVNKFKEINDTLGHAVGDYCLIQIANAIKKVYGKSGYCYRIGGDEFSVILYKNLESLEEFNSTFNKLITESKYDYKLPTVSIGFGQYYPNKSSIQRVIEEADMMMYLLKQQKSSSTPI